MIGILHSFWVTKKYPVGDQAFYFMIGTMQINMKNTLEAVSRKKFTELIVNEMDRTHWEAKDGDTVYIVEMRQDMPPIPEGFPSSIQDSRGPITTPVKKLPKLTFA